MQHKRYSSLLATGAVMAALAFAAPALADTATTTPQDGWHDMPPMGRHMPGVVGTVSAISGTTLTVTEKERPGATSAAIYSVNAGSATVMKGRTASSLSAIAVGDTVMVQGTISGTTVTATHIEDGMPPFINHTGPGKYGGPNGLSKNPVIQGNGQPIVGGTVSAISGSTLTVVNKGTASYSVDASNATIEKGHATSTLSSVAVGDHIVVQGAVSGTSITASSLMDQGAAPSQNENASGSNTKPAGKVLGFFSGVGGFLEHLFGF